MSADEFLFVNKIIQSLNIELPKKIVRSVPERFDAKAVAKEENKNLNTLKV